jgi:hypothetical protein
MGPALTALLIARSTAPAAQSSAPATKLQSPPDGSTVTVTGCLTRGEPAGSFILANVGPPAAKAAAKPAGDAPMRVLDMRSFTHVAADCK